MDNKRPEGREKNVTGRGKGLYRRGSGLNTGPVGSQGSNPHSAGGQQRTDSSGVTRSGGRSPLLTIIIIAVLLFGGGGGALSGLLGGGSSTDSGSTVVVSTPAPTVRPTAAPSSSGSTAGGYSSFFSNSSNASQSPYANLLQGSSSNWQSGSSTVSQQTLDSSTAAGSRAKYTTIQGRGQDTVTVMVYMCGTDLESRSGMATRDLIEMTKASLSDKMHILVYTGGCTKWNNQVISASVNQIYEIQNGGLKCLEQNMGNGAMTDPNTLSTFIQWCAKNYPANRNELIFWDHGGGSVSGYGYDQKNPRSGSMTLAGINTALKAGGVKFDFIGFDACLMATLETGLMLDDYADYMIASEETEPGIGWYYTNWVSNFAKNTSMPTVEVGKQIVDDFVSTCASQCQGQSATLSVVDLAELANTAPAPMKAFSQSISSLITNKEYQTVSNARNGSREFARSSAIDQIDLVHFAWNMGNSEGRELASALQGAVKYNRTSTNMSNAYGLSIYFPYRKTNNVDNAVKTYNAIGMDESYSKAIREFASLEVSGQAVTGGTNNPYSSLFGTGYGTGSSAAGGDLIGALLSGFLGGDFGSVSGLSGSNTDFMFGRSMSTEDTVAYLTDNCFDPSALTWTEKDGKTVISLDENQWSLVEGLDLNMFFDDGEGYIDLGLDTAYSFSDAGDLLAPDDITWLGVNEQVVAYYHEYTQGEGSERRISGYIPAYLNGDRVELLVVFDAEHPSGYITGARPVYVEGETDTVAKSLIEINDGDVIDFICDYYSYDGSYENSYLLGERMTVDGELQVSDVFIDYGTMLVTYRFTDLYQQHYWTETLVR